MTDYEQEQADEIEALQSILMDDIEEVDGMSSDGLGAEGRCFIITIAPKHEDEDEPTEIPMRIALAFMHTVNYPDESPVLKVRSKRGVRTEDVKKLQALLEEQVEENLGMAMIFTLVTFAKEWFIELVNGPVEEEGEIDENDSAAAREEAEQKKFEAQRAQGTPVTAETWQAWFTRFAAEMALEKAKNQAAVALQKRTKPTGRELFEKGTAGTFEGEDDADFDEDFDEDFDDDDLLDEYLAEHSETALAAAQAELTSKG
mmetsp:Transcript_16213/g.19456  ORF Transcript_16213/g.19456 Transcript_16213/m.19456 type:complete len:259 (-) Transcript_16213:147-923(-)|eukprot:CAMPEP_0197852206 /NCGR_PEP_ID=MMETSP1438-20131217/19901_1 /TAXON_ID=1461541 /ORGANISM="Pterosperma sp., Strain CCMP1384" /LENGTH=258 /DNA_ID=CAMNT_0043466113 /DNA_START=308 /DNA_END=1084 /DNA_ORIENTATION=-